MVLRPLLVTTVLAAFVGCSNDERPVSREPDAPEVPDAPPSSPAREPPIRPERSAPRLPPAPLGECVGPEGRAPLRTLVIGNSNIYYWDLPRLLSVLSRSAPPACPRIDAEGFTRGGQNLMRLWEGGDSLGRDLATTIRTGAYDIVVISESIDLLELDPPFTQYVTYATRIIDAARTAHARPILYASPYVDKPAHAGFLEMARPQLDLAAATSVDIATAGLAWLRVWQVLPDVFLHHTDHSHPGFKGSMISSMVLYAIITRATPLRLTTAPEVDCHGEPCPRIGTSEGRVFQQAAWEEALARLSR